MAKRSFTVRAIWDDEAGVYYAESDIVGLHIEARTVEEFEALIRDLAPDLIVANHISAPELATTPLAELIPTILWERPSPRNAAA
jgi:hypothetical protein